MTRGSMSYKSHLICDPYLATRSGGAFFVTSSSMGKSSKVEERSRGRSMGKGKGKGKV
jgi:hypothetical protein